MTLTQGSMLERECHNILDSLDWHGKRVPWEALADNNLDAAEVISRAPVVLLK